MSPYKNFLGAAKAYFESIPFLRFLLSAHIYVFSLGGLIFLLGSFIGAVYDPFTCIGGLLVFSGLLLTIIKEDVLTLLIASGALSAACLISGVVGLITLFSFNSLYGLAIGGYGWGFRFQPLFYFLFFGAITIIVLIKSDKLKQMRAQAAARSAISCPRCNAAIPKTAAFCPTCGAPNPSIPQYAPPAGQQYAPPQYAPPDGQQYAPPPYAPPPGQPYAPVPPPFVPAEPPVQNVPEAPAAPQTPAAPEASAVSQCVNCGAELPPGAVFCGKCGAKQ